MSCLSPIRQVGISAQLLLPLCWDGSEVTQKSQASSCTLLTNDSCLNYFKSSQYYYCWHSLWHLILIWMEFTPTVNHPSQTESCWYEQWGGVSLSCKANQLRVISWREVPVGKGWANARGCPLRPHFQSQFCHKAQLCQAHVRHCRLVTSTHPVLSKFADSPHFISRDRVPVAIARRWQFANLNWAVSELHRGLTPTHRLMQMKRSVYCKDNLTS